MAINSAALALIKEHEGLRLDAYPDPAHGWSVPTIGYGHTSAAGAPIVLKGMRITAKEAEAILKRDLAAVEADVLQQVKVPLNANQFGALVSFTFNLGSGNLRKSTLLKRLNAGAYQDAAAQFGLWINAAGKPLPGLIKRREAERMLFLTPTAAAAPQQPSTPPGSAPPERGRAPAIIITAIVLAALAAAFFLIFNVRF
ncbi:lysozyme [Devosia sp.]|uniref:lysozyme n=1 Tax=Devosia sp. TaxID=1871048 RepID=UPI002AFE9BF5|nr:lysozyme [Devosia sp.]